MKTLFRVTALLLVAVNFACAPSKREQLSKDISSPTNVNPVTIPIQFSYGPENLTYRFQNLVFFTADEEKAEHSTVVEINVKAAFDPDNSHKLIWDYRFNKFSGLGIDSEKIPKFNFQLVTDRQGKVEKSDVKFEDKFEGTPVAKAVYNALMSKTIKSMTDQLQKAIATYPINPVKTDDVLNTISSKEIIEPYEKMFQLKPSLTDAKNINTTIKGSIIYENRQYFIATADDKISFEYPSDNSVLDMTYSEFILIDPKSFHIVKQLRKTEILGNRSSKFKKAFKLESWQDVKVIPSVGQN